MLAVASPKTAMTFQALRGMAFFQGRITTSRMAEATSRRKAVVPAGPTRGKMVLASEALAWMEDMETSRSRTEMRGDVAEMFMKAVRPPCGR